MIALSLFIIDVNSIVYLKKRKKNIDVNTCDFFYKKKLIVNLPIKKLCFPHLKLEIGMTKLHHPS